MNKIKLLYIAVICSLLGSCSEWLTVNPSDQVSEKDLNSSADGFHNRTNGIYRIMASRNMYGKELTWGFVDALAIYYDFSVQPIAAAAAYSHIGAGKYDYENPYVKTTYESIWDETFNAIANCNSLISDIDVADPSIFQLKEIEQRLIHGEALGLRAMLHFDMLRLYAPSVKNDDGGKYIPYVKDFPVKIPEFLTVTQVLENAIADLLLAEEYTAGIDTLDMDGIKDIGRRLEHNAANHASSMFLRARGYRLNHYAIKALLARVYMYKGSDDDKVNALSYANEIISLHAEDNWFEFTHFDDSDDDHSNVKLYDDVIFALYNNKFSDIVLEINTDDETFLTINDYENIFSNESDDYRAAQWANFSVDGRRYPAKLLPLKLNSQDGVVCNKMQPMIRLSEMYYIAAECNIHINPTLAGEHLTTVREKRGVENPTVTVGTDDEFINLILNDVRRESYGEGQLFFFYKRLNLQIRKGLGTNDLFTPGEKYVLPRPESADIV